MQKFSETEFLPFFSGSRKFALVTFTFFIILSGYLLSVLFVFLNKNAFESVGNFNDKEAM